MERCDKLRLASALLGTDPDIGDDKCVSCGSVVRGRQDFRDDISLREFGISGFCQKCQDSVFGDDVSPEW